MSLTSKDPSSVNVLPAGRLSTQKEKPLEMLAITWRSSIDVVTLYDREGNRKGDGEETFAKGEGDVEGNGEGDGEGFSNGEGDGEGWASWR